MKNDQALISPRLPVLALAVAVAVSALAPAPVVAKEAGDILVRARVLDVVPHESGTIGVIGGKPSIDTSIVPEVDFSYFFTDNIAVELILAVTPHDVAVKGSALGDVKVGDTTLLPPTLTLQYHFFPKDVMSPYVGVGVNYTTFFSSDAAGGAVTKVHYGDSFGPALQAGMDIAFGERWMLNFDVKKVWVDTKVNINDGAILSKVNINPWIFGAGIGYRF